MTRTAWRQGATFLLAAAFIAWRPAANAQEGETDACLSAANEFAQRGDFGTAESKARECLRLAPHSSPVFAYLGMILTRQGRPSEANVYLERAVRIDASRTSTRFNLALNEFRLGQLESAANNLEMVLKQQPNQPPAKVLLGTILAEQRKCPRAVGLLESVTELARQQPDSVLALARCYYVTGERDKARQMLRTLLEQRLGSEWVAMGAGVAGQANDPKTAEALLSAARSQHPSDFRLAYSQALVEYNAGRFPECRATLEGSIAAGMREADAFDLLAWCRHRQGDDAQAAEVMQQAIQLEPSSIRYTHLAQMLVDEKNYSEALGAARKATEFPNPGPPAWRVRATVEFARGMFKQAADSAAKAVELDSHDPDPLLILSAAEQKLFRYAEAKSVLEKGMRLFPGQARFSVQYGKLLLDPGGAWSAADQKSAVALLESVLARDDSLFEAHLALGRYWVSKGSTAQALPHLVAAARLSPREAQVHFLLASAYRLLGRASDAAEEIGQYQALQGAGAEPASGGQGTKPVPKVGPDDEKQ